MTRGRLPILALVPVLLLGLAGGWFAALQFTSPCPLGTATCTEFATFWRAWEIASDNFVDPNAVDPAKMTDGAISGMLDSLGDQGHTAYLSPTAAASEQEQMQGSFEGIGAYIDVREGQPLIIEPIEGSPAERAGIMAGDLIMAVNGESVRDVTIDELRGRVRGPKGTEVTLTIRRAGVTPDPEITVTRDAVRLLSVSWRMLPGQVAHVRINRFANDTSAELISALGEIENQDARTIVLDVRNNPGGLVSQLVRVASQFLPAETTILIEVDRAGERTPYPAEADGIARDIPLVVLINGNSASAAEILAAALRDAGRAPVVGERTFGTATVLRPFTFDDGAQMRLGIAQWLTPKGEEVRGIGVEPTEPVAMPPDGEVLSPTRAATLTDTEIGERDPQLARALELARQ